MNPSILQQKTPCFDQFILRQIGFGAGRLWRGVLQLFLLGGKI